MDLSSMYIDTESYRFYSGRPSLMTDGSGATLSGAKEVFAPVYEFA